MKSDKTQKYINVTLALLIILMFAGLAWSFWHNLSTRNDVGKTIAPTSIAVPTPKEPRGIVSASIDESGNLVLLYSDDTSEKVGRVTGESGQGLYPTDDQVAQAVKRYCGSGACEGKTPTSEQVIQAVIEYCGGGACKGQDGKNAVVTTEQILSAVATYCSNGACRGAVGAKGETGAVGATGPAGASSQMACVIRATNGLATRYVAWKYESEPNSAYKDLYKLPVWAECIAPVDLRA